MVTKRLVEKKISAENVLKYSDDELKELIFEVNFNRKKVKID